MPSDLRERIVGMIDTAAPPIDVEALAQHLAAESARDPGRDAAIPPMRRPVWAFAAAFGGVLLLVGGALVGGLWLHKPTTTELNGFGDTTTAPDAVTSGWWLIAFALVVVGLGAATLLAGRRRNQRPRTREEDVMQTMERTEHATDREVEKLTTQRRWLAVTLAFVLVVGTVAIGWLVAENQSLSSETGAAVWPAESELTPRMKYMADAAERYWSAWNAEDFDTIMSLYAPFAVHGGYTDAESSPVDSEYRSMMERFRPRLGEYEVVRMLVVGSFVIHVIETDSGHREGYTFRFGPGLEPVIVSSYYGATAGGN